MLSHQNIHTHFIYKMYCQPQMQWLCTLFLFILCLSQ